VFVEVAYGKRALQICANELRAKDRPHPGDELPEDVIELREGRRKHVGTSSLNLHLTLTLSGQRASNASTLDR
jgi:hypothetical protein